MLEIEINSLLVKKFSQRTVGTRMSVELVHNSRVCGNTEHVLPFATLAKGD